ncbi:MAG: mechanosensitive ion channel family protein, partial [Spirochaetales bacterium]|nr:mechanosensitive ion channel family protein [Spirochaetales bacterium]
EQVEDMFSMLGRLINKAKPYFEDRWPRDSKKWRDKTPSEKFASTANYVILVALLFIFFDAKFSGEQSVWYYCITGKWDSGINLYSITSCIISISMLIITKIVFHKIMFLIAKVTSARGETICHLLDNFSSYGLFIAGIFVCLHHFGVNATALSLTGGVAGVIFGIGCQNIVADILAGIIMTLEGSAHVGEFVSFNGQYAVILNIGVRTTKLKWFGEVTVVRNNDFKNYVRMPSNRQNRAVVNIGIDLKESLERVEAIIEKELPVIHDNLCAITGDPVQGPTYMGVRAIDGDCITLSFNIMCKGVYYAMMQRALNAELKKMFDRNCINLAMHQVVVNQPKEYPDQAQEPEKEGK